jgi:predicted XRE-type DNA-binding protein
MTTLLYTQSDAARLLKVSRQRVHQMCKDGLLVPSARLLGGSVLFSMEDVANAVTHDKTCAFIGCQKPFKTRVLKQKYCDGTCRAGAAKLQRSGYMMARNKRSAPDPFLVAWTKYHLKHSGQSQTVCAEKAGIPQGWVSAASRGKGYVSPAGQDKLRRYLESLYPVMAKGAILAGAAA